MKSTVNSLPVIAALTAGFSLAAPAARADDWLSLGLDDTRTRTSAEITGSRFDAGDWKHEWKSEPQISYRALVATPSVGDGYVAFATQRNLVRVISALDGHLIWETQAGGTVFASPAIWHGLAFVLGGNQRLFALRLTDGSVAWQKDLGAMGQASPVVVDGSLFVVTASPVPRLWRIEAGTGKVLWQAGEDALNTSSLASVAIADGHVLAVQMEGQVFSFSVDDGKLQWMAPTHGRITMSSPLVVGGRVYVLPVSDRARLHALDLKTGAAIDGWPLDVTVPAPDARFGASRERKYVVSSPAGGTGAIVFTVRADDYFGTNLGGQPDTFLSQELLVAVDGTDRKILWTKSNGLLETKDPNLVPNFEILSTPALFRSATGELLLAAASSVAPTLRVIAANGDERWTTALSAPTRSSPVFANGRLMVATDSGVIHGFLSATNQPPRAPTLGLAPAAGSDSDAAATTLHWGAAIDPEGQAVRYQVRVDDDGEVLRDWDIEMTTVAELQSVSLPPLPAGATYTFAIRARDTQGALSAWTDPQSFHAVASPAVTVDGQPAGSLTDALATAHSGATIRLGPGLYALSNTLHVPDGVNIRGAGPHLTTLSGKGLAVAVAPGTLSGLFGVTVTGARIGVQVDNVHRVQLRNVILRDNADVGLDVTATGAADVVNGTIVRNGVGVRGAGETLARNCLVTGNDVGLMAAGMGGFDSSYNDVYQNRSDDYRNVTRAPTDLGQVVAFDNDDDTDLRLKSGQPTTDKGYPGDEFDQEPAPNGGRINIGAFGNTEFAELSLADIPTADAGVGQPDAGVGSDAGTSRADTATSPSLDAGAPTPAAPVASDGCACTLGGPSQGGGGLPLLALAGLALLRRATRRRRRS
jgi:outer membrane protein assembly factor BamB